MAVNRRAVLRLLGTAGTAAVATTAAPAAAVAQGVPLGMRASFRGIRGRLTGAQAAVAALICEQTRCVFGVPGAQNNELWDAMKAHGVPYLLVTNESSASVMADGAARATGEVGVFSVVPGPGLTNALTGIGEAMFDSIPIVGIVTDVDRRPGAPIGQVHGLPNVALLQPVCKAVLDVGHVSQIPGAVGQAFRIARCGEPGPVAVVIPYPLLIEAWDYDVIPPPPPPLPFDEAAYQRALCLLAQRHQRVGIYAGLGCAEASPALTGLAEVLQAPVATSVSGKGVIPDSHPLAVGWGYGAFGTRAAEWAFRDVDLVLAIGVRYSEVSTANYAIPKHPRLIHVDANPRNLGRNVPADVAVCADASLFLARLLDDRAVIQRPANPKLIQRIRRYREIDRVEHATIRIEPCVDPMFFLVQLRQALCPQDVIVVDVTASTHWASEAVDVPGPRRYMTPADNQSMGWAIPAAIGAQRVCPECQVACVTGDGCFLMSGLEVSTAARDGIPVKFFVLDDGAYHYMQMLQEPTFRRTTATEIARLDYAAMAVGMRIAYNEIGSNLDVPGGIARALAHPGPVLTRLCVSYEGRAIRWLSALKRQYINHLSTDQKLRFASRIAVRTVRGKTIDD